MPVSDVDLLLVAQIRSGDEAAWRECISRYEGRLLAFVDSRLRNRTTSEDVVQDTFMGFLVALPNYDEQTPLEAFLFSIAAHKLTDVLRRQGRRPTLPFLTSDDSEPVGEPASPTRQASSMARSHEKRNLRRMVLEEGLRQLARTWIERQEFERLKCMELLFVLGWANKTVAETLNISEQAVANHKHFVLSRLREWVAQSGARGIDVDDLR